MGTFAATNHLSAGGHHQFRLGLVMILLLGLVSTTSMEWSILCFIDFFASPRKEVKKKNRQKMLHSTFVVETSLSS